MAADVDVVEMFLELVREKSEAAEFERLTLGAPDRYPLAGCREIIDEIYASDLLLARELSALESLKANLALDRLKSLHPALWEEAELAMVMVHDG